MKRVLILDANQRSALATTRSLGRRGISLVTADEMKTSLSGCSRYSEEYVQYPSPTTSPEHFITTIADLASSSNIHMIFPMTELTSALLLMHKDKLPEHVIIPMADIATIENLSNKCTLMQLAKSLKVPIPQSLFADTANKLPMDLEDIPYPLVLKPGKSWLQTESEWIHTNVKFATSPKQAAEILKSDPAFQSHPFMLQECVPGHGQGVFALYNNGRAVAFFSHKRLREKPPRGGVSVLSESISVDPTLQRYAQMLLDSVNWHGAAMVEFKVDKDGTPYLMEINTRFWGSLQLAIDAGVDFPWLLYNVASGQPITPVEEYKLGVRLRWLLGDLDSLYLTIRDKDTPFKTKLHAVGQFFTPHPFKTRHEVNRWSDPAPICYELYQYIKDILK